MIIGDIVSFNQERPYSMWLWNFNHREGSFPALFFKQPPTGFQHFPLLLLYFHISASCSRIIVVNKIREQLTSSSSLFYFLHIIEHCRNINTRSLLYNLLFLSFTKYGLGLDKRRINKYKQINDKSPAPADTKGI